MYVKHQSGKTLLAHHHLPCSYVLLSISTCGRVHVHNTCVCFIHCLVYFCKTKQKKEFSSRSLLRLQPIKPKLGKKYIPCVCRELCFHRFILFILAMLYCICFILALHVLSINSMLLCIYATVAAVTMRVCGFRPDLTTLYCKG